MAKFKTAAFQTAQSGPDATKRKPFASFRREVHDGRAIYIWHGMRASSWFRLLRRIRFNVTAACLPQVLTVSLVAPLNSLLSQISEALFRDKVQRAEFDKEFVFILGYSRSGTTYLHELIASDPKFGFPTTYECLAPSHFLLTEPVAHLWLNLFLPKRRPQDNVPLGLDRPQEDEVALCVLGFPSPLMTMAQPRLGPADMKYLDLLDLTEIERSAWIDGFLWFIRCVAYRQQKPLVLKSPAHTARLRTLIKLFPKARFIYIARDPFSIFPSSIHLWKSMNSTQGLQNPALDDPWLEAFVLDSFMQMFERYEEDRALIPEGQLTEIRYEDLVRDPISVLRSVYERVNLGDFARAEKQVEGYLARSMEYKTNKYDLPDDKREMVRERWAPYFERFGYA